MAITQQHFQIMRQARLQPETVKNPVMAVWVCLLAWVAAIGVGISVGQLPGVVSGVAVLLGVPAVWLTVGCRKGTA